LLCKVLLNNDLCLYRFRFSLISSYVSPGIFMYMAKRRTIVPKERIAARIIVLRDEKVMLDTHLAELYKVETRVLKQAVRRNIERFPKDFMFELSEEEVEQVVSQNVIPSRQSLGGAFPFAFTETGVAMLATVLRSDIAVEMNIAIMRTFVALRKMAWNYEEIMKKIHKMEAANDKKFEELYEALKYLLEEHQKPAQRKRIGYRREDQG